MAQRSVRRLLILLIAFLALTVLVGTGATDGFDSAVLGLFLPLRTPSADAAFELLTLVGGPIASAVVAIAFTAFLVARGERDGWFVLVLFVVGIALEIMLKQLVFQPGPPSELTRDSALLPTFRDSARTPTPGATSCG